MTWQQTIDEEKDIAFEEGVRQGLEQGIEQGLYKARIENAKAMLAMNVLSYEQIAQGTGLPLEKILELSKPES